MWTWIVDPLLRVLPGRNQGVSQGYNSHLRICLQCRRSRFCPWVRKILWRREWQPTPVFLLGELHGQRSLAGYSPWGGKKSDMTEWLTHTHFFTVLSTVLWHWTYYPLNDKEVSDLAHSEITNPYLLRSENKNLPGYRPWDLVKYFISSSWLVFRIWSCFSSPFAYVFFMQESIFFPMMFKAVFNPKVQFY